MVGEVLADLCNCDVQIDNGEPFLPGSEEEVEIRACSVTAVEMLKVRLVSELGEGNSTCRRLLGSKALHSMCEG